MRGGLGRLAVLVLGAGLVACQSTPDTGDTYLLAAISHTELSPDRMVFRNVDTDERYVIQFRGAQAGMVAVPAGRYVLQRVDSTHLNLAPLRMGAEDGRYPVLVEAGHVNDWGGLVVQVTASRPGSVAYTTRVAPFPDLVPWARERYPEVLGRVPVHRVVHEGAASQPLPMARCDEAARQQHAARVQEFIAAALSRGAVHVGRKPFALALRVDADGGATDVEIEGEPEEGVETALRGWLAATLLPSDPGQADCALEGHPLRILFGAH